MTELERRWRKIITLDSPSMEDFEKVRLWRNSCLESLRTSFMLTKEMQENFYKNVICNRQGEHRFWSIKLDNKTIGLTGFVGIQWENRLAEISLIISPLEAKKGYGSKTVALLLDKGFNYLNFDNIYGECYTCNPAVKFWEKICNQYSAYQTTLPNRKYWQGEYWDAMYFSFARS